jgi:hypothetical protein
METAIVSILCIALMIFGGMTMSQGFMTSVDASTVGLGEIGERDETIMRTDLTPISTNLESPWGPDPLEITLENTGQTKLADFAKWDVIVQYYDSSHNHSIFWLPYSEGEPGSLEWTVEEITLDGEPETFEPGVLNPGEQITLRAILDPSVHSGSTNMVVVSTPSGITAQTYFSP